MAEAISENDGRESNDIGVMNIHSGAGRGSTVEPRQPRVRAWRSRPLETAFRCGVSLLLRRIPRLRQPLVPYDCGRSRIVADLGTALGLGLYRYGDSVDADIALVGRLLQQGDVFVDAGAHVGLFTLVAAARVGRHGAVIAFEPGPWARTILTRNIRVNAFDWVRVVPAALAEKNGLGEFAVYGGDAAALSSFAPPEELSGGCIRQVPTVTLDIALTGKERARLKLVKFDLEGAEVRALQGAGMVLREPGPDFLVEVSADNLGRQGATVEQLAAVFRAAGYQPFLTELQAGERLTLYPAPNDLRGIDRPNVFMTRDIGCVARSGIAVCA